MAYTEFLAATFSQGLTPGLDTNGVCKVLSRKWLSMMMELINNTVSEGELIGPQPGGPVSIPNVN
jgi:hypothetical protein